MAGRNDLVVYFGRQISAGYSAIHLTAPDFSGLDRKAALDKVTQFVATLDR